VPSVERLFAVAAPGLERVLLEECQALPAARVSPAPGGVVLEGEGHLSWRANLELRTPTRILLRLEEGPCADAKEFRARARKVEWARWLKGESVRLSVSAPRRFSVEEIFQEVTRRRVEVARDEEGGASVPGVWIRVTDDGCTLSLDTSGELLHKRGYRQEVSRAPLRETLAAALLHLAEYSGSEPLWDPMCGSGTLVIEGALIASARAPGLSRHFAFEQFPTFNAARYEQVISDLKSKMHAPSSLLLGSDLHAGSLGTARRNARRAEVLSLLRLERWDARTMTPTSSTPGLLVANLPYGIRVGEKEELGALYRDLGSNLKAKFGGWRFGFLVADDTFERLSGLPVSTRVPVQNGGIRCQFLQGRLA
jgi:putative N6-adenine-specific DNA methylase